MLAEFLKQASVKDFEIKVNNLGCDKDKKIFIEQLKKGLRPNLKKLCEDCRNRFEKNVLRVLDCKNPDCKKLIPAISGYQCASCEGHYHNTLDALNLLGVKYKPHAHLVRGLDYYTGTVFEVTSGALGAQDAIAAGGRYDNLIEDLGGPAVPAIGFAIGVERLLMAAGQGVKAQGRGVRIYFAALGEKARKKAFELAAELRSEGVSCVMEYDERSLKAQLRAASASRAAYAAILGEDELKKGKIILRDMSKSEQSEITLGDVARLRNLLCNNELGQCEK
jgi:histidyl-tRNA synthetase